MEEELCLRLVPELHQIMLQSQGFLKISASMCSTDPGLIAPTAPARFPLKDSPDSALAWRLSLGF